MADGKLEHLAALDERTYGPEVRAARKEAFEKHAVGDNLGAAVATLKTQAEGLKHYVKHPVDSTMGSLELLGTPASDKAAYLKSERDR